MVSEDANTEKDNSMLGDDQLTGCNHSEKNWFGKTFSALTLNVAEEELMDSKQFHVGGLKQHCGTNRPNSCWRFKS